MYKILSITIFLFMFICPAQKKQIFPIEKLSPELKNSSHIKIIAFMPSVSEDTEYASMIIQAFKNYFVDKLAFAPKDRDNAIIDVILISQKENKKRAVKEGEKNIFLPTEQEDKQSVYSSLLDTQGMQVFYTINAEISTQLALPSLEDMNANSILFLLDESNTIVWRDDQYRGQGEHLKPLEYKVKDLLHLPYPKIEPKEISLKVGDKAPDVLLTEGRKISDYKGNVLVFTFYPAAYSGVFDIHSMVRRISMERFSLMSCAVHISSFDEMSLRLNNGVQYFAVSESTPELLENWKNALGTHHIQYINDPDYYLAQNFGSYNPEGYTNRMTVIIDKKGEIAYIDQDYKLNKEAEIQKIIQEL